jgi:transketolase
LQLSDTDIRDALFDTIYDIATKDRDLVFLTDDMDAFSLRRFKQDMPDQFINIGVAEQNMINVAAGLATCGKKVFAYGIASYVTMRCLEQIKVNLCSMNLPVTIIGVGPGFSFEYDGPTHHGVQDVSLMRSLPEMSIYNLSDISLANASAHLAYQADGPVYIRLDKGKFPDFRGDTESFSKGFRVLRPLADLNIVSTGFMTPRALAVAEELKNRSINAGVVDLYRLKPIDNAFFAQVIEPSSRIVTVEENSIIGGIGSIVTEVAADKQSDVKVHRIAVEDRQFLTYGRREWHHQNLGIDLDSLVNAITEIATPSR